MAEADVYTKNYIAQNHVFADVFNFFIWGGDQVIQPDSLEDESIEEGAVLLEGGESETAQRYRDVLKSCVIKRDEGACYVLLGVENQTNIHYAMPVRAMVYDALQYDGQVKRTAQKHRQHKDKLAHDEFLSGFTKEDHLTPVITLVVYFGSERWDAPRSVHQMFDQTYDERLLSFVPDYKINLLEPAALSDEDLEKFTSDFGHVMDFLRVANDKQRMKELLAEGSPFESISTSAALVLNSCANIKIKINQDKETTDMCKALQEIQQEAVDKAVREEQKKQQAAVDKAVEKAVEETVEKEQKKQQEAVDKAVERTVAKTTVNSLLKTARALMANLSLSADQALQAMSVSETDFATLKPMLQV